MRWKTSATYRPAACTATEDSQARFFPVVRRLQVARPWMASGHRSSQRASASKVKGTSNSRPCPVSKETRVIFSHKRIHTIHLFNHLYSHIPISQYIYPSVYGFIHSFIYPIIYPSIIPLSLYLSTIYLSSLFLYINPSSLSS